MTITESKPRKPRQQPKPTKLCLKCGRVRDANDYYTNKDWEDQLGKDVWCKECVNRCTTKDNIMEYCWENHRQFTDRMWEAAQKKAERLVLNNIGYQKGSEQKRAVMLEKFTAQQFPSVMSVFYKYEDNTNDGTISWNEAKAQGIVTDEQAAEEKVYSSDFNGYFTERDLEYLKNYYAKLEEDFNFDNETMRDYAKKVCKSSLQADKLQDAYAAGRCAYADVKDAMTQFDTLSKSANFAACRRKAGETSGLTCWAETTYKLETTGHTMQNKIEWEEDDVDRVIASLKHIVASLNL